MKVNGVLVPSITLIILAKYDGVNVELLYNLEQSNVDMSNGLTALPLLWEKTSPFLSG